MRMHSHILVAAVAITAGAAAQTTQVPRIPTASERLHKLFEDRLQWQLHAFPAMALRRCD